MALQQNCTKSFAGQNILFTNAYHKVIRIVEYSKEKCMFDIAIYPNKSDADNNINLIDNFGFTYIPNLKYDYNILTECYIHLKSLAEYSDSEDV